jgi:Ca2+-binding EF-hand superfamily protein
MYIYIYIQLRTAFSRSVSSEMHAPPPARKPLTMEEAREVFDKIDKNHDGNLSQIEFIKALRKNPALATRLGDVFSIECVLCLHRMCSL